MQYSLSIESHRISNLLGGSMRFSSQFTPLTLQYQSSRSEFILRLFLSPTVETKPKNSEFSDPYPVNNKQDTVFLYRLKIAITLKVALFLGHTQFLTGLKIVYFIYYE